VTDELPKILQDPRLRHFKKPGVHVAGKPDCSGPSRREVKIDVWKYLQTIVMGLYAVCEEKLYNQDRTLRLVHAWRSEDLSECIPHSPQKIHMHPCMRVHATVQKLLSHGSSSNRLLRTSLESCASIVQTVVYCPPSRPPNYCLDQIRRPMLFAQEIRTNPR